MFVEQYFAPEHDLSLGLADSAINFDGLERAGFGALASKSERELASLRQHFLEIGPDTTEFSKHAQASKSWPSKNFKEVKASAGLNPLINVVESLPRAGKAMQLTITSYTRTTPEGNKREEFWLIGTRHETKFLLARFGENLLFRSELRQIEASRRSISSKTTAQSAAKPTKSETEREKQKRRRKKARKIMHKNERAKKRSMHIDGKLTDRGERAVRRYEARSLALRLDGIIAPVCFIILWVFTGHEYWYILLIAFAFMLFGVGFYVTHQRERVIRRIYGNNSRIFPYDTSCVQVYKGQMYSDNSELYDLDYRLKP